MSTRAVSVYGVLLNVQGRYVCWDSFKAAWYLGPRRLSEIFPWFSPLSPITGALADAMTLYPSASIVYERNPV